MSRPTRPLASKNGWMVSNWYCISAILSNRVLGCSGHWQIFPSRSSILQLIGMGRRHKCSVLYRSPANPVLAGPKFSGPFCFSTNILKQNGVGVFYQLAGERQSLELLYRSVHRVYVVLHLVPVVSIFGRNILLTIKASSMVVCVPSIFDDWVVSLAMCMLMYKSIFT